MKKILSTLISLSLLLPTAPVLAQTSTTTPGQAAVSAARELEKGVKGQNKEALMKAKNAVKKANEIRREENKNRQAALSAFEAAMKAARLTRKAAFDKAQADYKAVVVKAHSDRRMARQAAEAAFTAAKAAAMKLKTVEPVPATPAPTSTATTTP